MLTPIRISETIHRNEIVVEEIRSIHQNKSKMDKYVSGVNFWYCFSINTEGKEG